MRQSKHDGLVEELRDKLFQSHDYDKIWLFWEYSRNGQIGEVDLLAFADDISDFYEVKCNFHSKSVITARKQYKKFQLAFPEQNTNGFIYTRNRGLMRL